MHNMLLSIKIHWQYKARKGAIMMNTRFQGFCHYLVGMGITTVKSMHFFLNDLEGSFPSSSYRSLPPLLKMSLPREDFAYFQVRSCNCGSLCIPKWFGKERKVQLHQHRPQFYRSTKYPDILAVKNLLLRYQKQIKLVPLKLCEAYSQSDCNASILWVNFTSAYSY